MTADPNTASIDQCRDWIAENVLRWTKFKTGWCKPPKQRRRSHPAGGPFTDAAIAAMPKGWFWSLEHGNEVIARAHPLDCHIEGVQVRTQFSHCLAAWRLCLAMHQAEGRGK